MTWAKGIVSALLVVSAAGGSAGVKSASERPELHLMGGKIILLPKTIDPKPRPSSPANAGGVSLILDDGSIDGALGFEDGGQFVWLNRFTPAEFPLTLDELQVLFGTDTGVDVGELVDVYLYEDTDGDGDPGTGAVHRASLHDATVQAVDDVTWSDYPISPVVFNGPGDILIAVVNRTAGVDFGSRPAAIDLSSNQARSWVGTYFGDPPDPPTFPATAIWSRVDNIGLPGNWMIRGFGVQGVVLPGIGFSPDSMMFIVPPGHRDSMAVTLTNSSSDTIHFTLSDELQLGRVLTRQVTHMGAGGDVPWMTENPEAGSVPPLGSTSVQVIIDATGLSLGEYFANLVISSDDLFHPDTTLPIHLEVGGAPDIALSQDSVIFPEPVLVNDTDTATIWVGNLGDVDLGVSSVVSSNPAFSTIPSSFSIEPLESLAVEVVFHPIAEGQATGTLTFMSDDPDEPSVAIFVSGDAVNAPSVELSSDSITAELALGDSIDVLITLTNIGGSDLNWFAQVIPPESPLRKSHETVVPEKGTPGISADATTGSGDRRIHLVRGLVPVHVLSSSVLFDNGPLVNSPGSGVGGADESVLQNISLGMTTFGFPDQRVSGNRIADDFTVTGNGWQIDQITFFSYQTFSDTISTTDHLNYRIWNGPPNRPNSIVIFGDTVTNRIMTSTWSHAYRVSESTSGGDSDRPVMMNVASADVFLPAGTYWLDWQTGGTLSSGPWAPPITISGEVSTGNALQFLGAWSNATDVGQQGFPFLIEGSAAGEFIHLLQPTSGVLAPGVGIEIGIHLVATFNDTTLRAAIQFITNDPVHPSIVVPVSLSVGNPTGVKQERSLPMTFELRQNYPNPFNPKTHIAYALPVESHVTLNVYDILGQEVVRLVDETHVAGYFSVDWDGRNSSGSSVSSGVYFYRLDARHQDSGEKFTVMKKMVFLR